MKNIKSIITLCISMIFATHVFSQSFDWALQNSKSQNEGHICTKIIKVDHEGNIINCGYFNDTVDFDPGAGTYNLTPDNQVFIQKLDANGNLLWAMNTGGTGHEDGLDMDIDTAGNIYIATTVKGYALDLDPGPDSIPVNGESGKALVIKFSKDGMFEWYAVYANALDHVYSNAKGICVEGNYTYVTGVNNTYSTLSYFAGLSSFGAGAYIIKIDNTTGLGQWITRYHATQVTDQPTGNSLTVGSSGNIYCTGTFRDTANFDLVGSYQLITTNSTFNYFQTKLDSSGSLLWAKQIDGPTTGNDYARINLDYAGNIYTTGVVSDTVDFDPGAGTYYLYNENGPYNSYFIQKLDQNGNLVWAKLVKSESLGIEHNFGIDSLNDVYFCGDLFAGYYFDYYHIGDDSVFYSEDCNQYLCLIFKLNQDGNLQWARNYGCSGENFSANGLYIFHPNEMLIGGQYSGYVDFNPGSGEFFLDSAISQIPMAYSESYLLKLNECSNLYDTVFIENCDNYIFVYDTLTESGTYEKTVLSYYGCDSLITLNLSILNSTSSYLYATGCSFYVFNGDTLLNPGIYYDTIVNEAGCDSLISLDLSIAYETGDYFSVEACDSFYFAGSYLTQTGHYVDTLTNIMGCDSILTLDLSINTVDATISWNDSTLVYDSIPTGSEEFQWINCNGNLPIPNETNYSFVPAESGSYALVMTDIWTSCIDTSDCQSVIIDQIDNLKDKMNVRLYPNPSNGVFYIESDQMDECVRIEIVSQLGQTVYSGIVKSDKKIRLNLSNLPEGLYILKLLSEKKTNSVTHLQIVR